MSDDKPTVTAAIANIAAASAAAKADDDAGSPQRRAKDQLDQALSESPWYVRLVWYAIRDAWNWLIVTFAAFGGTLGLIKDYADANPDKFGFLTTDTRHWLSIVLNCAIALFGIISIVKASKK
jgi:hypothetical protein